MGFDVYGRTATVNLAGVPHARIVARPDGNCLFHAAGHGLIILAKLAADAFDHASFRAQVVDYVAAHAKQTDNLGHKLRDGLGVGDNQIHAVSLAQGLQIDRSVAWLRQLRSWGDEACITAIEQLYQVEVEVFDTAGAGDAMGVPWYVTSGAQQTKLRLCICMRGHIPTHYDLYIPNADYDGARDDTRVALVEVEQPKGSRGSAPPSKAQWVKQSAKQRWAYHLAAQGLELFTPAIGPRQFGFSREVIDGLGSKQKQKPKPLSVALGDQPNSVKSTAPIVAAVLRNESDDGQLELRSRSFTADTDALAEVVVDKLQLPLARVADGVATATHVLDLSHTELIVDAELGEQDQPTTLYLRFYRRARGLLAARRSISGDALVGECELSLQKLEPEDLSGPDRRRYTLNLAKALPKQLILLLTAEASPYQLVVAGTPEFTPPRCAWTHFHVPSDWDVNVAETFATVPVVMLDDSPTALSGLGVEAEVNELANKAPGGEQPEGRESFAMPVEQETALAAVLAAAGLGNIDTNACSYLVEVDEDEWYLLTSWASMACLERGKDGRYRLAALYWSSGRRAYVVDANELAKPNSRQQATQGLSDLIKFMSPRCMSLRSNDGALSSAAGNIVALDRGHSEFLDSVAKVPGSSHKTELVRGVTNTHQTARANELLDCETRYNVCRTAANALIAGLDDHAQTLLANKLGGYQLSLRDRVLPVWRADQATQFAAAVKTITGEVDGLYKAAIQARDVVAQRGLALVGEEVEGVKDFETGPGKHLSPGLDWKRHVFERPVCLTHAVTSGISSCAGGLTFTTEKNGPQHLFLWHIDARLSMPMLCEYERLWPAGKDAPVMRSLAVINPSTWEINKYRPDNIYPATVVNDCATVLFARSRHWYVDSPTVAGCDLFGVDVGKVGAVDWVFTYDIDKRISGLLSWTSLVDGSEDLAPLRAHFLADLYGAYRYNDAKPGTDKAMADYITTIAAGGNQPAIKRHQRSNANKSCRVPAISAATFEAISAHAQPLLTVERIYAGERGDWELAIAETERWTPGTTR